MSGFRLTINGVSSFLLLTALAVAIELGGCKTQVPDVYDWKSEHIFTRAIRETAEMDDLPSDVRKRTQAALRRLENEVLDPEPILVRAWVSNLDDDACFLEFIVLDEDKDLLGLHIREQYTDVNGTVATFEEVYPVYVGFPFAPFLSWNSELVRIRNSNQRKDEKLWQEYVNEVAKGKRTSMPDVWISIPEDNTTRVFMSVYDRAGNKSESVEVEY